MDQQTVDEIPIGIKLSCLPDLLISRWSLRGRRPVLSGVYCIECVENQSVYIGSSSNIFRRWMSHRRLLLSGEHHCDRMQKCFDKYGMSAFVLSILEIAPKECLVDAENKYIRSASIGTLLNVGTAAAASMLGRHHSDAARKKMSISRKGRKFSEAHRAAMSVAKKGVPRKRGWRHSDEAKQKMSLAASSRPSPMRGRKHSEATKAKIAASNRLADKSNRPRGARNMHSKAVEINGVVYETVSAASDHFGVSPRTVSKRIRRGMGRVVGDPSSLQTKAWGKEDKTGSNHKNARAVMVGELMFPCCKDAALAHGIRPSTFVGWLRTGRASYCDGLPPMKIGPRKKS